MSFSGLQLPTFCFRNTKQKVLFCCSESPLFIRGQGTRNQEPGTTLLVVSLCFWNKYLLVVWTAASGSSALFWNKTSVFRVSSLKQKVVNHIFCLRAFCLRNAEHKNYLFQKHKQQSNWNCLFQKHREQSNWNFLF